MAIENPMYKTILKEGPFEIRTYSSINIIESQDSPISGGAGFNMLFDYINGNNSKSMKIAMTAPVINILLESNSKMAFILPQGYVFEDIPEPLVDVIKLKTLPQRTVGVFVFSGNVNRKKIVESKKLLNAWLGEKGFTKRGDLQLARYNPPFIPGLFKHNELWQEVEYLTNN